MNVFLLPPPSTPTPHGTLRSPTEYIHTFFPFLLPLPCRSEICPPNEEGIRKRKEARGGREKKKKSLRTVEREGRKEGVVERAVESFFLTSGVRQEGRGRKEKRREKRIGWGRGEREER